MYVRLKKLGRHCICCSFRLELFLQIREDLCQLFFFVPAQKTRLAAHHLGYWVSGLSHRCFAK